MAEHLSGEHSGGDIDSMVRSHSIDRSLRPNTAATNEDGEDLEVEDWMLQSWKKSADDVQLMDVKAANAACRRSGKPLKEMDVLFIGTKDVGKTAVVDWLRTKKFVQRHKQNKGTRGVVPGFIGAKIRNEHYLVSLIDTSGEEEFRSVAPTFYRNGNGAMVIYDLTNLDSLKDVAKWHLEVMKHSKGHEDTPCVLIGNKTDLLSHENDRHKIVNGINTAKDLGMSFYFQTSAKNGAGIEEAMKTMISLIDESCSEASATVRASNSAQGGSLRIEQSTNLQSVPGESSCGCDIL